MPHVLLGVGAKREELECSHALGPRQRSMEPCHRLSDAHESAFATHAGPGQRTHAAIALRVRRMIAIKRIARKDSLPPTTE